MLLLFVGLSVLAPKLFYLVSRYVKIERKLPGVVGLFARPGHESLPFVGHGLPFVLKGQSCGVQYADALIVFDEDYLVALF